MVDIEIKYMSRALQLAAMGAGNTRPNPLVGAVIVHKGRIIGEGFHQKAGGDHAEVIAIKGVTDKSLLGDSEIYVTLEPCSHWGKTPPCAELIAKKGFRRVIIGAIDTSTKVSGRGVEIIGKSGIELKVGVLEKESRDLNRRFFCHHEKGRPYIVLKWAQSKDGFIDMERSAGEKPAPNWITGEEERVLVHKWRSEEHALLIGRNTLYNDDPSLDVRFWSGIDPIRVVLSEKGNLDRSLKILSDGKPTLVFTRNPSKSNDQVEFITISNRENSLIEVLSELSKREVQSILVEGGADVLDQFIKNDLWDEARIFTGEQVFRSGLPAPKLNGTILETKKFIRTILKVITPV